MPTVEEYNLIVNSLFDELDDINRRQNRPDHDGARRSSSEILHTGTT
jgi:hypothetical protein